MLSVFYPAGRISERRVPSQGPGPRRGVPPEAPILTSRCEAGAQGEDGRHIPEISQGVGDRDRHDQRPLSTWGVCIYCLLYSQNNSEGQGWLSSLFCR